MSGPTREDIVKEFPKLVAAMEADYLTWSQGKYPFDKKLELEIGSKYAKVVATDTGPFSGGQRCAVGFIVMENTTAKGRNFAAGDLLKTASWKAPALNFSRGNIFDIPDAVRNGRIRWTGIG